MTAINAMRTRDSVFLCTDSTCYQGPIVTGFVNKAVALPHLHAVIASSGLGTVTLHIAELLREFHSFDDLIDRDVAALLREAYDDEVFDCHPDPAIGDSFRTFIAGWSTTRNRPELYAISSTPEPGHEPFTLFTKDVILSPGVFEDRIKALVPKSGEIDPAKFLFDVIKLQRRREYATHSLTTDKVVGGHAILTRIDRDGISQRLLAKWPDTIGEPIDIGGDDTGAATGNNFPVDTPTTATDGMSRLQRERFAKRQRKSARRAG